MQPDLWQIVQTGGTVGVLVLVVWLLLTGRMVPGQSYTAMVAEKDRQIQKSDEREERSTALSERTIAVAEAMMVQIRGQGRHG
jgi:hypothetical protein